MLWHVALVCCVAQRTVLETLKNPFGLNVLNVSE